MKGETREGGEAPGRGLPRVVEKTGDPFGVHRTVEPRGLPQPAWRVDNDFTRLFEGELLIQVETLNIDAASFRQMEEAEGTDEKIRARILETVQTRGKQHNPVTGSGGMLLGRVLQVAPGHPDAGRLEPGVRVASLVSLSLTPLRIDEVKAMRRGSAQVDVDGEAVLFASGPYARLPDDIPERLALAVLDVAGAAPQVARRVERGARVLVLGAGGKSGILCCAEARRAGGPQATILGIESFGPFASELRDLAICDAVIEVDARDPVAVRQAVLREAGGEVDVAFSCVNVADAEMAAILSVRARGTAYFFAMSTSFTKAALGAEGVGKDVELVIGNGYAREHAEHSLRMLREFPAILALFSKRYT